MEWYERFGEECIWIHYITYCFMAIAKELAIILDNLYKVNCPTVRGAYYTNNNKNIIGHIKLKQKSLNKCFPFLINCVQSPVNSIIYNIYQVYFNTYKN